MKRIAALTLAVASCFIMLKKSRAASPPTYLLLNQHTDCPAIPKAPVLPSANCHISTVPIILVLNSDGTVNWTNAH